MSQEQLGNGAGLSSYSASTSLSWVALESYHSLLGASSTPQLDNEITLPLPGWRWGDTQGSPGYQEHSTQLPESTQFPGSTQLPGSTQQWEVPWSWFHPVLLPSTWLSRRIPTLLPLPQASSVLPERSTCDQANAEPFAPLYPIGSHRPGQPQLAKPLCPSIPTK